MVGSDRVLLRVFELILEDPAQCELLAGNERGAGVHRCPVHCDGVTVSDFSTY